MLPVVAIVGRPNVGKSTLFNCLTRSRHALVANEPGLTRDRQYGTAHLGDQHFIVVDTGGLSVGEEDDIAKLITGQAKQAIDEADVVLFMVDAREGLSAADEEIAGQLRRESKPVLLVANKTDGLDTSIATSDFYELGLGEPLSISASHRRGTNALVDVAAEHFPHDDDDTEEAEHGIKVAVVGRPNVGKSTLVNRILGENRVLAHDMPGTTRDSVYIPFVKRGRRYTLIDTAGIRRRARVAEKIERYSVIKSLQAIESANVIILLLDARAGVTDQDARLLGMVLDSGRALLLTVNKWDGLSTEERRQTREGLSRKLAFVDFSKPRFISALHGSRVGDLVDSIDSAWAAATSDLDTAQLTRILETAINEHPPPVVRGRRIKLRYAHQGGRNPPRIVIHGNQTAAVPDGYRRYLARRFRNALQLESTPVRIDFKTGENPYKGRRNVLTPRQQRKRQRLMRHKKR